MWNNLSRFKKILIILTITVSLLVIPLTIFQALTQQNLRQKASGNDLILGAYPSTGAYAVNDSVSVNISLTNKNKDISGIDFVISYDPNILRFDNFIVTNPGFTTVIDPNSSKTIGKIHYAGVNIGTASLKNTPQFDIGTVIFRAIQTTGNDSVTRLSFESPIITAANYISGLPVTQSVWQYTAKSPSQVSAPTATPVPSPTLTPALIPTSTPVPLPTATPVPVNSSSSDAQYNACIALCNDLEDTTDTLSCIQNCTKLTY